MPLGNILLRGIWIWMILQELLSLQWLKQFTRLVSESTILSLPWRNSRAYHQALSKSELKMSLGWCSSSTISKHTMPWVLDRNMTWCLHTQSVILLWSQNYLGVIFFHSKFILIVRVHSSVRGGAIKNMSRVSSGLGQSCSHLHLTPSPHWFLQHGFEM